MLLTTYTYHVHACIYAVYIKGKKKMRKKIPCVCESECEAVGAAHKYLIIDFNAVIIKKKSVAKKITFVPR